MGLEIIVSRKSTWKLSPMPRKSAWKCFFRENRLGSSPRCREIAWKFSPLSRKSAWKFSPLSRKSAWKLFFRENRLGNCSRTEKIGLGNDFFEKIGLEILPDVEKIGLEILPVIEKIGVQIRPRVYTKYVCYLLRVFSLNRGNIICPFGWICP